MSVSWSATQRRTEHRGVDACKLWERVVGRKDPVWALEGEASWVDNILDRLCRRDDFEIGLKRVEYHHPNRGTSVLHGKMGNGRRGPSLAHGGTPKKLGRVR